MSKLNFLTIKEARKGLLNKQFSCVELVESCLDQIRQHDPDIKAFLLVDDREKLIGRAKEADKKIAQGEELKPLEGIPIALKDLFTTLDLTTTAGSKIIGSYVPPYDATAVKKLKLSGAIILGKLNQDAWGHGSSGENSDYFSTKNPWDFGRVPGGSSSGSSAAVASGMCLMATGTDTGSSVRLPAAFCNLTGIKPTYGRVSRFGIIAMASSHDTVGHITRDVWDNAYVMQITAGLDEKDATTSPNKPPEYMKEINKPLKKMTIGIPEEYFPDELDSRIKSITMEAVKLLEKQGHRVKKIHLPHTKYAMAVYYILVPSEISSNLGRFDGIRYGDKREEFGAEAKRRIMLGTYTLSAGYIDAYYKKAQKARTLIKQDFEKAFDQVDFIVAPSSPNLPFKIGEKSDPLQMYLSDIFMCPVNLAGVPSLNIPCGFVKNLPVGMQIISPQFREDLLYRLGYQYQKLTDFHKRTPELEAMKSRKIS